MKDASRFAGDEVDGGLVVTEFDVLPLDLLLLVLLLLKAEDVLVEEVLQRLVGEVDTQLLKAVQEEVLAETIVMSEDDLEKLAKVTLIKISLYRLFKDTLIHPFNNQMTGKTFSSLISL